MNSQKKMWMLLILAVISMMILSGCSGIKTAKVNITIDPNPVPYSSDNERWSFNIVLDESNGIGVNLSSIRLDSYNQEDELIDTTIWYETGEEEITSLFGSNYLPAFSSLQGIASHHNSTFKYTILSIEGVDDDNNPIEAIGRADFLPQ